MVLHRDTPVSTFTKTRWRAGGREKLDGGQSAMSERQNEEEERINVRVVKRR